MKNPTQISNGQLTTLSFIFCLGTSLLWVIRATSQVAERSAWLAVLFSLALALPTVALYVAFANLAPTRTPAGVFLQVWGPWLGRLAALVLVLYTLLSGATMLFFLSEFFSSIIMPETPQVVFAASLSLLSLQMERGGSEQGARWSTLATAVALFTTLMIIIGLWPAARFERVLPFFGRGLTPIIRATLLVYGGITLEIPILLFYLPRVQARQRIGRSLALGLTGATLLLTLMVLLLTANLGGFLAGNLTHPLFTGVQTIELAQVYQRLDYTAVTLLVLAFTTKFSLCLQAASTGLAEVLGLREYTGLLPAMVELLVALSLTLFDDFLAFQETVLSHPGPALLVGLVLPGLTLILGKIKGWLRPQQG